jgi:hypothetical protein
VAVWHRKNIHIFAHHTDGFVDAKSLKQLKAKPNIKDDEDEDSDNLEQVTMETNL